MAKFLPLRLPSHPALALATTGKSVIGRPVRDDPTPRRGFPLKDGEESRQFFWQFE
jgi:hypothetical protein